MLASKIVFIVGIFYGLLSGIKTLTLKTKERGDFRLLCETKTVIRNIPVLKYKSLKTGIHVIIAKVESPLVNGQLTFATEAHDNNGLPHALEHLVFMGSEDYPYKGVLDLLANRCLAEGVNAWTDTDNTAYTVETAGKQGLLDILPIFVDHVFYPTLKNSSFITEIHHITGDGEDAGVVYSEMQEAENSQTDSTSHALVQMLYPQPSGYRYETGGILFNLRNNITIEKIRKYHKVMYKPENLHIVITGQIEPEEVFEALQEIDDKIASEIKKESVPFVEPWKTPPPPFTETQEKDVFYPSDIEDTGVVQVGWRGPSLMSSMTEMYSMEILIDYFIDTSSSPLNAVFVEVGDPLASYIDGYLMYFSVTSCVLSFEGVPLNKIHLVTPLLKETLNEIANDETLFNLSSMKTMIRTLILEEKSEFENSPHEMLTEDFTLDLLYGHNCKTLDESINRTFWYRQLLTKPSSYWAGLMKKYLISSPMAVIRGVPSTARAKVLQTEENRRIARRWKTLGKKGLQHLEAETDRAMRLNSAVPLHYLFDSFPVPSIENLAFLSIRVYTNIDNLSPTIVPKTYPSPLNVDVVPVKIKVGDVNSDFVQIIAVLDTQSLTSSQRLYLPLLLELLLESPVDGREEEEKEGAKEENKYNDRENEISCFGEDVFDSTTFTGLDLSCWGFDFGKYSQNVGVNFKVEKKNYAQGIEWLRLTLFRLIFDIDTVSVKVIRLLNSIGDKKRDGETILKLMFNMVLFKEDSNINKANILQQEKFLKEVLATIKTNPRKIIEDLYQVYGNITDLNRITIHLTAHLPKLAAQTNLTKPWITFAPEGRKCSNKSLNVISDWEMRLPFDKTASITAYITGTGSEGSAYLEQTTPTITDYTHPDLPALLIAVSYLTQTEGPLWNSIRGKGLAYDYLLSLQVDKGMLVLILQEATQLTEAYTEALRIIELYLNGTVTWNDFLLESARGSLVYEIIKREADISGIIQQSIYSFYRKIPRHYSRNFMHALKQVKVEDLQKVALKYFKPLIDPNQSRTFVVCPHAKVVKTERHLKSLGHRTEVISSLEKSRFSRL